MKYMKYTKEQIENAVKNSESWRGVCRELNCKLATGNQTYMKKRAEKFQIDFSHFTGQSHAKGKHSSKKKLAITYCFNGSSISSYKLKNKLIEEKIKDTKCEICGISEWNSEPVVLELDHKDSNHLNNEISNLQIICPNCHAQETRNRIKKKREAAGMVDNLVLETRVK